MSELFNLTKNIRTDEVHDELLTKNNISLHLLRLDLIHPVVSGNKIFKLHYFLEAAKKSSNKKIITFGGAYSNHLAATAFACNQLHIKSIGIVRGELPGTLSQTLQFCLKQKMHLEFISRNEYSKINEPDFIKDITAKFGESILIPEGGFSKTGLNGAKLIQQNFNAEKYSHICCAIGTATTFAGLVAANNGNIEMIGFPVLKNISDIDRRFRFLDVSSKKYSIYNDYHFGGYAKKTNELIIFMNSFYEKNKIPLDFVYTGKMMFGIYDLVQKNYFPKGSKICCMHTGGLQGNQSLPDGMLNF